MLELLQMWALVEVLGILFLPLTITVFHNLPDRGWAFSKAIGMAVFAFCVWLPLVGLQFLPYSQGFILGVFLVLAALNILAFLRVRKSLVTLVRSNLFYIAAAEIVFLGMVFLLGWIRSYGPDIRNFEMFMDEGFLAGIMRSPHMPPSDVWYAGFPINYYYYAHFTIATLAKLIGQSPSIAFNTGICTFFGLTAVNLFGVTCNIVAWARYRRQKRSEGAATEHPDTVYPPLLGSVPYGFLAMVMALALGNLASTQAWFQQHGDLPDFYWYNVTRVVDKTINEFPAFSFLLSCFHAHVLALAFTIVGIGLALNVLLERNGLGLSAFGRGWRLPLTLGTTALILGGLFTMNGWDFPTYLGLVLVCLALQQWMAHGGRFSVALCLDIFTAGAGLAALSFFLYAPFYLNFVSPSQGIGVVGPSDRSSLNNVVLIYGTFAFIFISLLLFNFLREREPAWSVRHTTLSAAPDADSIEEEDSPEMAAAGSLHSAHGVTASNGASALAFPANEPALTAARVVAQHVEDAHNGQGQPSPEAGGPLDPPDASDDQERASAELSSAVLEDLDTHAMSFPAHQEQTQLVDDTPPSGLHWRDMRFISLVIILIVGIFVQVLLKNSLTFVLAGSLAAVGAVLTIYHRHDRTRAFVLLLGTTAFALVAVCEVFYLRDVFASTYPRMNTVFKFYFQAWALLSITSGAGLYFILDGFRPSANATRQVRRSFAGGRICWSLAFLVFLLAGAIYPIVAPYQRTNHYAQRTNSLDGMAYMRSYDAPDYEAIQWINSNIQGNPTIVEAVGPDYSDYGRISVFTGLPTIMGWVGHEYQWRVNWMTRGLNSADFYRRGTDVTSIYTDKSPSVVLSLMARYQAQYLYVGPIEHVTYVGANLQRFSAFMQVVYSRDGVTIYKVPQSS